MIVCPHCPHQVSQKFGVEESEIHSALLSDDPHNALVIAYNLVIDNRSAEEVAECPGQLASGDLVISYHFLSC